MLVPGRACRALREAYTASEGYLPWDGPESVPDGRARSGGRVRVGWELIGPRRGGTGRSGALPYPGRILGA